jgi:transposase
MAVQPKSQRVSHEPPVHGRGRKRRAPAGREIHVNLDNQSTHKTKAVQAWLESHPNVQFNFTPTHRSWLNQVPIWFSWIDRDLIARGMFTSRQDLRRKLIQYFRAHNKSCRPSHWCQVIRSRRIRTIVSSETAH